MDEFSNKELTFVVLSIGMLILFVFSWCMAVFIGCASSDIDCRAWANRDLPECVKK